MKKINHIYVCSKGTPNPLILNWFKKYKFNNFTLVISQGDDQKEYRRISPGIEIQCAPKSFNTLYKKKEGIVLSVPKGEWVFIVEDNIIEVKGTTKEKPVKEDYEKPLSPQHVLSIVNQDIKIADLVGAVIGGYASNSNHFFRTKHYRHVGFVWGKMCYYKNDPKLKWDHSQSEMQDYVHSAICLKHSGRVLINNFLYAHSKSGGRKGAADYERRIPGKKRAAKYLVEKFKGLLAINDRPGLEKGTEVKMRMHSIKQIDLWRMKNNSKSGYVRT